MPRRRFTAARLSRPRRRADFAGALERIHEADHVLARRLSVSRMLVRGQRCCFQNGGPARNSAFTSRAKYQSIQTSAFSPAPRSKKAPLRAGLEVLEEPNQQRYSVSGLCGCSMAMSRWEREPALLTSAVGQPPRIARYAQAGAVRQCRAVATFRLVI
jgi:hypothetical protein